jgi:AcrR family transcriptional regulator
MPRRPDLARRAELARAAFDVLRTRGVQTSMSELADALGVKRPTLYFYFPDVGAVFESVLDQTYQTHAGLVIERMRSKPHPLDRLRAMIDVTVEFHRERPQLIGGLFQLWAMGGRDVATVIERARRALTATRDALIADLRGGVARREVRACNAEHVVDLVLSVLDGVLVHQVLGLERSDGAIEELTSKVIEPLRAKPAEKPKKATRRAK